MNRKKKFAGLALIICITFVTGFVKPDDNGIYKIISRLSEWTDNKPIEKVYLQFDKPYYSAGDDIWFKAYVTIGPQHKLSGLSGVLNVELIDERDSVKQHIKIPIVNGLARGDLTLSDTVAEGSYRMRAYTNYMRNSGSVYFFDQRVSVINGISNQVFTRAGYAYSEEKGQKKVTATINYTNADGVAYAHKEVKYSVNLNTGKTVKGKGITDDNGDLIIKFLMASVEPLNSPDITTIITTGKDEDVTKNFPIKATSANVDVQFFPESGNLVNGENSKVAFKAVGADGLGVDVKGEIVDDKNNVFASFSSQHLGMGTFNLRPQYGVSYKAHITYPDGSMGTFDLPKAGDHGYVLTIDNSKPDTIGVKIITGRGALIDLNDTLSLVAQSEGKVYYAGRSKPGMAQFTASILRSRFPSGIVQFTLFSSKEGPLNERLVFIQNSDQLKLNVSTDNPLSSPRQKVKIGLNATNSAGKTVFGSFSAAVVDETKVPVNEEDESSILANLLLTSDLKGYIEEPNYYFSHIDDKTRADLDVLMLTQGYHRFEWKNVINADYPPMAFPPEKTLQVIGHINTNGGKPVVHGKVSLVSTKGGFFILDTVTDEQGKFVFNNLVFNDSLRFVVQARTEKDRKNVRIDLDNIALEKVAGSNNRAGLQINVNSGLSAYMKSSKELYNMKLKYGLANHTVVLKEVVIKSTRPVVKYSTNLNGPGNADQVVTSSQLDLCPTLETCLEGKLFGVTFRNGIPYSTRGGSMTINLDGMFVSNDELTDIVPSDVASVEVLRSISYYGIYGSQAGRGGILVITTKRGDDFTRELYQQPAPGIVTFSPIGYHKTREFYSPKYDDPKTNTAVADLRSTIYWNSDVVTDKDGSASFEFYNAGSKGTYRVTIEGIDIDGNLGHQVFRYKVE